MDSKIIKYLVVAFLFSFNVSALEFSNKFTQGAFILAKTDPGAKVKIDKKKVKVTKDGYFVFGIGRDRKNDITFHILKDKKLEVVVKKGIKHIGS